MSPPERPLGRVVLLGATSEIGLATLAALDLPSTAHVVLAGRDPDAVRELAEARFAHHRTRVDHFDARDPDSAAAVVHRAFAEGDVDVVIPAFGVLGNQADFEGAPQLAQELLAINVTCQIRVILEASARMAEQGHGTIVVLSSAASVRPRRANYVYGASKAALDAFARGLADAIGGRNVRVLVVRPGFVIGRMTAGMRPHPFATTPEQVGVAVAAAIRANRGTVWVPRVLGPVSALLLLIPRPVWRRIRR